ncbi:hypothetical protein L1281_001726 [Neisseria sp. HSC-16F19]|nr:hypothetical protein [Neisseria sp. HSC-16F19]MCP2041132.1 hypothetical protein [Neisseria sp. HSC-16F19]
MKAKYLLPFLLAALPISAVAEDLTAYLTCQKKISSSKLEQLLKANSSSSRPGEHNSVEYTLTTPVKLKNIQSSKVRFYGNNHHVIFKEADSRVSKAMPFKMIHDDDGEGTGYWKKLPNGLTVVIEDRSGLNIKNERTVLYCNHPN